LTKNGLGYILGDFFTNASCHRIQGDLFGRIFAQWANYYFEEFVENYRSSPHFCATLYMSRYRLSIKFDKKTGWATLWAIFSQTHPVTLSGDSWRDGVVGKHRSLNRKLFIRKRTAF
jgi:hypothetical protein